MLSFIKSIVLSGVDVVNSILGGPSSFIRSAIPDPSQSFTDNSERRNTIAQYAEKELTHFIIQGIYSNSKPSDLGDSAIWQGVYTAMTVLRWRINPTTENQMAMFAASTALSKHFYRGILDRGAVPQSLASQLISQNPSKVYHTDPDGYIHYEDASLDSLLGVMFGAAMVNRLGDSDSKGVMADPLKNFSTKFTSNNFILTNRDGSATPYGNCTPGFMQAPVRILAATLPGLISGSNDWQSIANKYSDEFVTTDTQIPGKISWVNADLAILANMTYLIAAPSYAPSLSKVTAGLRTLMSKYADAGNSFLICGCKAFGVTPTDSQYSKASKILSEFSLGPKPKTGFNAGAPPALQPVPVWQRPPGDILWQRDPYTCTGSDANQYSRLDYLIAHYLDIIKNI